MYYNNQHFFRSIIKLAYFAYKDNYQKKLKGFGEEILRLI